MTYCAIKLTWVQKWTKQKENKWNFLLSSRFKSKARFILMQRVDAESVSENVLRVLSHWCWLPPGLWCTAPPTVSGWSYDLAGCVNYFCEITFASNPLRFHTSMWCCEGLFSLSYYTAEPLVSRGVFLCHCVRTSNNGHLNWADHVGVGAINGEQQFKRRSNWLKEGEFCPLVRLRRDMGETCCQDDQLLSALLRHVASFLQRCITYKGLPLTVYKNGRKDSGSREWS